MKWCILFLVLVSLNLACRARDAVSDPKIYDDAKVDGDTYIDDTGRLVYNASYVTYRLSIRCSQKEDGSDARQPDDLKLDPTKGFVFVYRMKKEQKDWLGRAERSVVFAKVKKKLLAQNWTEAELTKHFEFICAKDIPQDDQLDKNPYPYEEGGLSSELDEMRKAKRKLQITEADRKKLDEMALVIYETIKDNGKEVPGEFKALFY